MEYQVYGNAYHCLKKQHVLTTSMSFWGAKFESLKTEVVKLTKEECALMSATKKCEQRDMDCDGEYCSFSSNPSPVFNWMTETTIITYSCSSSPKLITAKSLNENLFNSKCKVADKQCV
ncbi:unnamed protein product, partial [Brachionus calyciflorus]